MKVKEDFIKWLDKRLELNEENSKLVDLFFEWLNEDKENESQKERVDFIARIDENFRAWIIRTHNNAQLKRNRQLEVGDAIIYKTSEELQGFMVISSFDFESDFVARALIGKSPYKHEDGSITYTYCIDYTPWFDSYSFATEEEIEQFVKELKENNVNRYNFIKEHELNKEQFKKYSKYFD